MWWLTKVNRKNTSQFTYLVGLVLNVWKNRPNSFCTAKKETNEFYDRPTVIAQRQLKNFKAYSNGVFLWKKNRLTVTKYVLLKCCRNYHKFLLQLNCQISKIDKWNIGIHLKTLLGVLFGEIHQIIFLYRKLNKWIISHAYWKSPKLFYWKQAQWKLCFFLFPNVKRKKLICLFSFTVAKSWMMLFHQYEHLSSKFR